MAQPHPEVVDPAHPLVVRVRAICLTYPEAVEVNVWGRPTFRAGKKIFVVAGSSMTDPLTIVFKPDPVDAPALRQDARSWHWTRTPSCADTVVRLYQHHAPVAQRIEHLTTDQKVGGSNPSGRTLFLREQVETAVLVAKRSTTVGRFSRSR
jgi:hypothetical protein